MILIFYEIITIPYKISFDIDTDDSWDHFVDAVFLTDILISFNTAFYQKGIAVYYFSLYKRSTIGKK
jgi:hyperpolarization activated cyclic nucleotide-gated potassium channel 2